MAPLDDNVEAKVRQVEAELKRMVTVVNDEVVPGLRRDGGKLLRALAEQLQKMAESLER
jgi:hypothetical protein